MGIFDTVKKFNLDYDIGDVEQKASLVDVSSRQITTTNQYTSSYQATSNVQNTDSRQYSSVYDLTYAPNIILNSAGASQEVTSKKEVVSSLSSETSPVTSTAQAAETSPSASAESKSGLDLNKIALVAGIAASAIAVITFLPKLKKVGKK